MSKKPFAGFPARADVTPVPNLFFTQAMSDISDTVELKTVLYVFWLLAYRRGYPRFVTSKELFADEVFNAALGWQDNRDAVKLALDGAVAHGVLLHVRCEGEGHTENVYVINNDEGRKAIEKIEHGEIQLPGLIPVADRAEEAAPRPNIFALYEQNIGMLTPIIAQELQDAEQRYPEDWIDSAFKEAVTLNKRNWKYIVKILQRWAAEGKDDGTARRHNKKDDDRDKYIQGKYGHMVQR